MKNKITGTSKNNVFDSQFKSLNNDEMISLKGGTIPPLPPPSGNDFPLTLTTSAVTNRSAIPALTVSVPVVLPVAASAAAVEFEFE